MHISLKRLQWDCYEFPHHHNAISTIINQLMTQYHMGLRIYGSLLCRCLDYLVPRMYVVVGTPKVPNVPGLCSKTVIIVKRVGN